MISHSEWELYRIAVLPRQTHWGHTQAAGYATRWESSFPGYRTKSMGIDESVALLRRLGIDDVGPFVALCQEQGWAII